MTRLLLALLASLALSACNVERPRVLGDQCDLNSDCNVPLVCGLGRCHRACTSTRDCDIGSSCAKGPGSFGVCLLPDETRCLVDSDCPTTLVCRNESCVNVCEESRDCLAGDACVELDGRLSCTPVETMSCTRASDCPVGLTCGRDANCRVECLEDRDCPLGEVCREDACSAADSALDAGPTPDAGADAGPFDAGTSDGGQSDAGASDAGPDAGPPTFECASASECASSSAGDGASFECLGGRCVVTACGAGRGDCDFDASNGCEQALDVLAHCGGCGLTCAGPGATCGAGGCSEIAQLTGGQDHQCYRWDSGGVYCWGDNDDGELGDGNPSNVVVTTPVAVPGLDAIDVSAGDRHTCAIERSGQVVCWGYNTRGQVGDGSFMQRLAPAAVLLPDPATDPAVSVAAGDEHSCAVLASGDLYCWGRQSDARLGNSQSTSTGLSTPVQVNGIHSFMAVAAAQASTCGLRTDGEVMCWGNRSNGQVGDGATAGIRGGPSGTVHLLDDAVAIANGAGAFSRHTCALRSDAVLNCWGSGAGLGYGSSVSRPYAVMPVGMDDVRAFGVGSNSSCAADGVGDLYCWGTSPYLPVLTALGDVSLVTISNDIVALSGGRIYTLSSIGAAPHLVEGF